MIRTRAAELGIDGIGFCDSAPLADVRTSIADAIARGCIPPDIAPARATVERFIAPRRHLRSAVSVVSAYETYNTAAGAAAGPEAAYQPRRDDPLIGTIAGYTTSNYYGDLKTRLSGLAAEMQKQFACRTKVFTCYVTLAEKPLARKAGLGFYGKHGIIVTPNHGSWVVLGEILTDLAIEPDKPLEIDCGECRRCIEACPTGALKTPYFVDRNLCIQAHCGRRTVVPLAVRERWGNRFYGCTDCQDACPHNQRALTTARTVARGHVGASIPLSEVLLMDEAEFSRRFADNQIGARERNVIRRDAIIAAGNSRSRLFEDALCTCAQDTDPMVRQHALWAIWRIRGNAARHTLSAALGNETDPAAATEIKSLLDVIAAVE